MTAPFPNAGVEDDRLCACIGPGVWLMDDHRWAFYVWARHALEQPERLPLPLVHIDAHADAVDGFLPDPVAWSAFKNETDLDSIYQRVALDTDITLAAFIAPAVRHRWVREVHFFGCAGADDLLDAPLLASAHAMQRRHATIPDVIRAIGDRRLLLDVDIDVFNRSDVRGEGRLWPERDIVACIDAWAPLVRRADVITIARSFGFSGTAADTVRLTEMVVSRVLAQRAERDMDIQG